MFDITGYYEAQDLTNLFELLAKEPTARIIAGGTDVLVKTRARLKGFVDTPLIGISRITAMKGITSDDTGTISIGALSTFDEIEHNLIIQQNMPLLSQAVSLVGGPQTRRMGTLGGNVCNAGPAADGAPALFTYNAICEVHSATTIRNIPITEFYQGVGKVRLRPGEVLVKFKIAQADYQDYRGYYIKFAQRAALDIANLSCAALIKLDSTKQIQALRICFGAAAATPIRMPAAETYAVGKIVTNETLQAIGKLCLRDTQTIADWRASKEYRDHLVTVLPVRALALALKDGE